ncbi:LysM peptidoglycan-binding domain-containing protein [Denitrobaculum tricleocarpae]|uniref:LysM peptidoglycan-binding domain-containing protein n=1 Tax=Denitrobaculum tricleocarpae TaxID=2591009 RepID=A0A545T1Z8_9PROT|nr:LysM peptidoglycan-binding domain-containing protein [Denitrobaculum tricleocarpae]TQV71240.1 LysM peptidoglycan-binding domain-containing protein [Denitrobaculum tricleocarpae]
MAGRAPAGSEVTIYDGDTPLGIVTADSRGQWVLVLEIPLSPGSHRLGIIARLPDEAPIESAELVIVAVPEPEERLLASGGALPDNGQPQTDPVGGVAVRVDAGDTDRSTVPDDTAGNGDAPDSLIAPSPIAPNQVAAAGAGVSEPIAVVVPRRGSGPARILQKPDTAGEGIGNGSLFLDSVDYDDDGRAVIGGRANAGAALIVYLDNIPIGEALTGEDGRWAMTPEDLVPVGLHRLRVDQVESDGKVLARVETPFSRAESVASNPDEDFVTVQPGNSLWRIARTTYGQGTRYTVIYEINKEQIRDPDLIYPGQIFRLPSDG